MPSYFQMASICLPVLRKDFCESTIERMGRISFRAVFYGAWGVGAGPSDGFLDIFLGKWGDCHPSSGISVTPTATSATVKPRSDAEND